MTVCRISKSFPDEYTSSIPCKTVADLGDLEHTVTNLLWFSGDLVDRKAYLIKRMNSTEAATGSTVVSQNAPRNRTFASISDYCCTMAQFDEFLQQLPTYSKAAYPKSYIKALASLQKCMEEKEPVLEHILDRIVEQPRPISYQFPPSFQMSRVLLGSVVVKFVLDRNTDLHSEPSNGHAGQKRFNRRLGSHKSDKPITT